MILLLGLGVVVLGALFGYRVGWDVVCAGYGLSDLHMDQHLKSQGHFAVYLVAPIGLGSLAGIWRRAWWICAAEFVRAGMLQLGRFAGS